MSYLDCFCEILKQKFLMTGFINENEIVGYKLKDMTKNFYHTMSDKTVEEYKNGGGNELRDGKMNMIRSSSAMIYNLLGNDDIFIKNNSYIPEGLYTKNFEEKYKTVNVKAFGKQVKANLDAWLKNDNCEIFIESKCMEWIENSGHSTLTKSYVKNTKKYFFSETAEIFRKVGCEIDSLQQYDSCQMFKHSLSIYNYLKDSGIKNKKVYLLNIVWEPNDDDVVEKYKLKYKEQLNLQHKEFSIFYDKMKTVIDVISNDTQNVFDILYFSIKEFCSFIEYNNEKQAKFIQRYL